MEKSVENLTITKKKRRRRGNKDLLPVLKQHRNEFRDWCYAGRPEIMRKIEPDYDQLMENFERQSIHIPEEKFQDADTIKIYGKNLFCARKKNDLTLQKVARSLDLHHQNLAEIEAGKRKEIDRDILLLLCGMYHERPEVLMGMKSFAKDPMEFYNEHDSKKANYIMRELYGTAPILLHTLLLMISLSHQKRVKLLEFIESEIEIKLLDDEKIDLIIDKSTESAIKRGSDCYSCKGYLNRNACYAALCKLAQKSPELMDAYISIVHAGTSKHSHILKKLISSDFFDAL